MSILSSSSMLYRCMLASSKKACQFTHVPSFQFAKLTSGSKDDGTPKYSNSKEFYDYLLKFTAPDARGYIKFNSSDLNKLVKIATDESDIKTVRDAYYNFLGHKVTFTNAQIDRFIEKAISLSCAPVTHEILQNHNYLMYYPHTSLLNKLTSHYAQINNTEAMLELSKIFASSHFLKVDSQTLEIAANFGLSSQNNAILFNVAHTAYTKDINNITSATINAVLAALSRHRISGSQKETSGTRVETKFLQHIKKISQSYHTIIGRAYLALAQKEIDSALVAIADFNLIDKTKLDAAQPVLIQNDSLTTEFVDHLASEIVASGKQKYADRVVKVIGDIQAKLGDSAIHPDIKTKLQSIQVAQQTTNSSESANDTANASTSATA